MNPARRSQKSLTSRKLLMNPQSRTNLLPTFLRLGGSQAALWVGALLILALGGLGITLILLKQQINCNVTEGRATPP